MEVSHSIGQLQPLIKIKTNFPNDNTCFQLVLSLFTVTEAYSNIGYEVILYLFLNNSFRFQNFTVDC